MCSVAGAYSNTERGEILSLEALNRAAFTSLPRETENFFFETYCCDRVAGKKKILRLVGCTKKFGLAHEKFNYTTPLADFLGH